ncbi:MAG: type 4a pilus biogenesis protein PilO [Candidatus Hydrogenedentes bacterium]|nr:type 4a pilus biogenesis protein PilO [Candidatus Hydrogenedentota bacterium]
MLDFFKGTVTAKDWAFVGAVLGITGLLCAGFYFGVYKSQQAKLVTAQETLAETVSELKEARTIRAKFDEFKQEADKATKLVEMFEDRLPEEREIPRLLEQFEKKGDDLGLTVELTQLPSMTDANKETIPYEIIARGDFHEIVQFINLLERDQRYLKVSNLDIGEEIAGISEATFQLSTFRFIQRTDTASVASNEPGK